MTREIISPMAALPDRFRRMARRLRRYQPACARAFADCARMLELAQTRWADDIVGLREASQLSGYSQGALRRMARDGVIPNYATAPREYLFRRGDLPRRPGYGVKPKDQEPGEDCTPVVPTSFTPSLAAQAPSGLQSRRQTVRAVVSAGGAN